MKNEDGRDCPSSGELGLLLQARTKTTRTRKDNKTGRMRNGLYRLWCVAGAARGVARGSWTKANAALCEYVHTSNVVGRWSRDRQWEAARALSQRVVKEHAAK